MASPNDPRPRAENVKGGDRQANFQAEKFASLQGFSEIEKDQSLDLEGDLFDDR